MKLPVLTLIQPWASWVMLGWKTAETRTSTRLLGRLQHKEFLIHAGKAWDEQACEVASRWLTPEQIHQTKSDIWFTRGLLLCVVRGGVCKAMQIEQEPKALIQYKYPVIIKDHTDLTAGWKQRYALPVEVVRVLDNKPLVRGQQGIWYHEFTEHG